MVLVQHGRLREKTRRHNLVSEEYQVQLHSPQLLLVLLLVLVLLLLPTS